MLRKLVIILCLLPWYHFSQDFTGLWEGHFSYNEIKDIAEGNNNIYAAADNAIFILNTQTNEIEEINTVSGLSGETITAIYYSELYELLIIGYENGLIELFFEEDGTILTVVDILDKTTIPPTDKSINHFNSNNNEIYIATDFGISVYDLEKLEFGDTYFIGVGGAQVKVNQTTIFQDYIYAACDNNAGIIKAPQSSSNLIDFRNWELNNSGSWGFIGATESTLYAANTNRKVFRILNNLQEELVTYNSSISDLKSGVENIVITTEDQVFVYDTSFNIISEFNVDESFETQFTSAISNLEHMYIGTADFGLLKTTLLGPQEFEEVHPDGPLLNIPFSIQAEPGGVWVTFGEYDLFFNPYPLNNRGFSHLRNGSWINNPYSESFDAKCLNTISINPENVNQVFLSSFFSGLLEVNDDEPTIVYNQENSGLESLVLPSNPNYVDLRVGPSVFDEEGLLWTMTSRIDDPLKSYNPSNGQWQSYSFTEIISDGFSGDLGFKDMVIGPDGTKWVASYRNGLIGFNENGGNNLIKNISMDSQNMPSEYATAVAIDNRNQLWIGTFRGLRVLFNTSNFFEEENISVDEIIIEEDGIAKELLFQQNITDIEVDGSNNKWISTSDSGVFYFSPNGQNTIFHFTEDNSPLPSNGVKDLSIDGTTGRVYMATDKGLVSFKSGGSSPIEDLDKAFAYPNPVRPGFDIVEDKVKIKDVSDDVNIKITDIEGNLVAEAQSRINQRYRGYNLEIDGGTAYWNGKNLANNIVASGVYLIMISDLDSFETKVIKLMVVR